MPPDDILPITLRTCLSNRCRKERCSLNLQGIEPDDRAIIDCDEYIEQHHPRHKLCDYIVVCDLGEVAVIVIEMKGKAPDTSDVTEQLNQGARLAARINQTNGEKFMPLLLHQGINSKEFNALKKLKVRFRNKEYAISAKRCGVRLRDLL